MKGEREKDNLTMNHKLPSMTTPILSPYSFLPPSSFHPPSSPPPSLFLPQSLFPPPPPHQVVYQNILKLSYVDKLLDQVHLAFRDRYKNEIMSAAYSKMNFSGEFQVHTHTPHTHTLTHTHTHTHTHSHTHTLTQTHTHAHAHTDTHTHTHTHSLTAEAAE